MSGFSGINQFGSLTTQSGQRLTFKDFDKDGDGKITQEEYDTVMNEMKLDSVELSSVDKNGDKEISEDEFAQWEQKTQMQTAVNDMAGTISKDFAGKTQYLAEVTTALKEYIEEFAASYTGDISGMAEAFKAALPAKYEEIKSNAVSNDPDTVKSNVLDEIYTDLTAPTVDSREESGESMPAATAKRIAKELEAEADKFIKGYNGEIYERGKGWGGSRDKAYAKGEELLTNESLKSQMKAQLQSMLEEKGISFDKIANIFENV